MLRVTVDLIPFGYQSHKHTIGQFDIANRGTSNMLQEGFYKYDILVGNKVIGKFIHDRNLGLRDCLQCALAEIQSIPQPDV